MTLMIMMMILKDILCGTFSPISLPVCSPGWLLLLLLLSALHVLHNIYVRVSRLHSNDSEMAVVVSSLCAQGRLQQPQHTCYPSPHNNILGSSAEEPFSTQFDGGASFASISWWYTCAGSAPAGWLWFSGSLCRSSSFKNRDERNKLWRGREGLVSCRFHLQQTRRNYILVTLCQFICHPYIYWVDVRDI